MKAIFASLITGMMLFGLAGSAYASYTGMGLAGSTGISARQGSSNGIFILGGGPNSGK